MKIQCDVCNKNEATVFCTADEAAVCDDCDHRVHHVNKLASKHQRFSLIQPSPKQSPPLCDICQERRGFLFCQQDRAIMCRECDLPIHKANEHTQKHNRYLLTGIKLSANSTVYSSSASPPSTISSADSSVSKSQSPISTRPVTASSVSSSTITSTKTAAATAAAAAVVESVKIVKEKVGGCNNNGQLMNAGGNSLTTSSISEYLEMLPGWHVEDFLDCSTTNAFSKKIDEEDMLSFWDTDLESQLTSFPPQNVGIWVPQAPPPPQSKQEIQTQFYYPSQNLNFGGQIGLKESREVTNTKSTRKWTDDNSFAVPQIKPPSTSFKRSRTLW